MLTHHPDDAEPRAGITFLDCGGALGADPDSGAQVLDLRYRPV